MTFVPWPPPSFPRPTYMSVRAEPRLIYALNILVPTLDYFMKSNAKHIIIIVIIQL